MEWLQSPADGTGLRIARGRGRMGTMATRRLNTRSFGLALAVGVIAGVLAGSGCGTTQLTSMWKDPSYNSPPLKKLMVIALRKDPVNRRMWEDAVVTALVKEKTTAAAVPSYRIFPDDLPRPEVVAAKAKDLAIDGVLIISKVERDTLINKVVGYTTQEPVTEFRKDWRVYVTRFETVYHPGYTETSLAVSVRTDLLLTQGDEGRMVWSATSNSIDPTSRDAFRTGVAGLVAKELAKASLIP
jgi:hypothetical protein